MELQGVAGKEEVKMNAELNILDLSGRTLHMIFQYLTPLDLTSTHQTCKKFQIVSIYSFSRNYKAAQIILIHPGMYIFSSDLVPDSTSTQYNYKELKKILQHFGQFIKSLKFPNAKRVPFNVAPLLKLLAPAAKLKHLQFSYSTYIPDNRFNDLTNLFVGLQKLELDHCFGFEDVELKKLLKLCVNLKELTIKTRRHIDSSILDYLTPKIERIFYMSEARHYTLSAQYSLSLLQSHPKLKSLRISKMYLLTAKNLDYLANVEILLVDTKYAAHNLNEMVWTRLFQLKSLKQLEFIADMHNLAKYSHEIQPKPTTDIETFAIKVHEIRDAYNLLNAFTFRNLKKLVVIFYSDYWVADKTDLEIVDQIKNLARNLVNVEEIHFMCFPDKFMSIVSHFVKYLQNLKILVLDPYPYRCLPVGHLTLLAAVQRNKNDELIVKYGSCLNETVKQALEKDPSKFGMLKFIPCASSEFDYLRF